MEYQVKNGPQSVKLHALYQFNKDAREARSAKFQMMIHTLDMKQKEFYDLESECVDFGKGGFNVYKGNIPL